MARHSLSLQHLMLRSLHEKAFANLLKLSGCTNVRRLQLGETATPADLWGLITQSQIEGLGAWLASCDRLEMLDLLNIYRGPALASYALVRPLPRLLVLSVSNCSLIDDESFFERLALQTSLETLTLEGHFCRDALFNARLVKSVVLLVKLRNLRLQKICGGFGHAEIAQICENLPLLEGLAIGGTALADCIWADVARLKHLRLLQIHVRSSRISASGVVNFIRMLDPGCTGLVFSMMLKSPRVDVSPKEQEHIRTEISKALKGSFDLHFPDTCAMFDSDSEEHDYEDELDENGDDYDEYWDDYGDYGYDDYDPYDEEPPV